MLASKSLVSNAQGYIQVIKDLIPASFGYMDTYLLSVITHYFIKTFRLCDIYSTMKFCIILLILKTDCLFLKENSDLLYFLGFFFFFLLLFWRGCLLSVIRAVFSNIWNRKKIFHVSIAFMRVC